MDALKYALIAILAGTPLAGQVPTPPKAESQASASLEDIVSRFGKEAKHERLVPEVSPHPDEQALTDSFGTNKDYYLIEAKGKMHAVLYNNGKLVFDREIDAGLAQVIRRLYNPSVHIKDFTWNNTYDFKFDEEVDLDALNKGLPDERRVDDATVQKAKKNIADAGSNARQLLAGLELLTRDKEHVQESVSAGIWYLANMGSLSFSRLEESKVVETKDLAVMDATTFYENIHFAVRARNEFAWGKKSSWDDFLHNVLPARATNEPLQNTRRHVYEALRPALLSFTDETTALVFVNRLGQSSVKYRSTAWQDISFNLMLIGHEGRCEEQVSYVLTFAKAGGLNAFSVSVPSWGKSNDNHVWIGSWAGDTLLSRMATEPDPSDPRRYMDTVVPKVYGTSTFGRRQDLTARFTHVGTLEVEPAECDVAFLNVFNYGVLLSVAKQPRTDKTVFPNVGNQTGILYQLTSEQRGWRSQNDPATVSAPFIFGEDGKVTYLGTEHKDERPFTITSEIADTPLNAPSYRLAVWNGGNWQGVEDDLEPQNGVLTIEASPNAVYHLFTKGSPIGRPFAFYKGEMQRF